ncbi:hypothetical protein C005_01036 [Brucella melitensis BG2 (S27)]|nr:hypothetical protein C005_01036 [Brucella melitensis BG2 (S27)]
MRCRGFSGTMPATPATAAQRRDAVFASLFFCAMFGLLLVEFIA